MSARVSISAYQISMDSVMPWLILDLADISWIGGVKLENWEWLLWICVSPVCPTFWTLSFQFESSCFSFGKSNRCERLKPEIQLVGINTRVHHWVKDGVSPTLSLDFLRRCGSNPQPCDTGLHFLVAVVSEQQDKWQVTSEVWHRVSRRPCA